jgi:O-antigen/teichoic acid export membrane protein
MASSLSDKAALLIGANTLKYAIGFALPMVLVRFLAKEDYGTYLQLNLISNMAVALLTLGLPTSVYYFYAHRGNMPNGRPTLIAQTQVMLVLTGLISALMIGFGAPLLGKWMSNEALANLLPIYAFYVGVLLSGEHFMHVMISQNRYGMAVTLEAGETAVRVGCLLFPIWWGLGLHGIAYGLIVYAVLRMAVRSFWLWRGPESVTKASWAARFPGEQLAYALPLAASTYVATIGGMLDRALVAIWFLPADYAIYSVGALEIPLDVIFQGSVANVLRASLPALVQQGNRREIVRIWREAVRKLAIVVVPLFITTLFTKSYAQSTHVFRIYMLLVPLHMFVLSSIPQIYGKTRLNLYVVFTVTSTNVVISLILLKVIGIYGPAIALVISQWIGSAIYFVTTMRLVEARATDLLPTGALVRTTLAACLSVLPAFALTSVIQPGLLLLVTAGGTFSVCFFVIGYFAGVFQDSDVRAAKSVARRLSPRWAGGI